MDNKFYVSYEAARLLKEKGYKEETICYYNSTGKLYLGNGHFNHNAYPFNLTAPTKAEAIDWLESKGIVVVVYYFESAWQYLLFPLLNEIEDRLLKKVFIRETYPTRLEAEEAAIIKALELL